MGMFGSWDNSRRLQGTLKQKRRSIWRNIAKDLIRLVRIKWTREINMVDGLRGGKFA